MPNRIGPSSKPFAWLHRSTVGDALKAASADPDFSGIDIDPQAVGVYGKRARTEQVLAAGDRVEIYRALALDPKAARRARVKQARRGHNPWKSS